MQVLAVIVVVIAATVLLSWYSQRKLAGSWSGTVTSIRQESLPQDATDSHSMMVDWVRIDVRTDQGRRLKLRWPKSQFDQLFTAGLAEGDRLEKAAGALHPGRATQPAQG